MCIRDSVKTDPFYKPEEIQKDVEFKIVDHKENEIISVQIPVSYTHLRAHETVLDLVCRLLLEKKQTQSIFPITT